MGDFKKTINETFSKLEKLTKVHKILICVGTIIALIGPMGWFSYKPKYEQIEKLKKELETAEKELADAKRKAAELSKVMKEFQAAEAEFKEARKALPEKEEIPSLLTSISHSGQDSNLEFLLFKPESEKAVDLYAELPVSIQVTGKYSNVMTFFDKISKLNRIVTVKNITMRPVLDSKHKDSGSLTIGCSAVTYKFIETPSSPAKPK